MRNLAFFTAAIMASMASVALAGPYMEAFGTNNANWQVWTVNNGGGQGYSNATFGLTGGDHGGAIRASLTGAADRLYGIQPADASKFQDLAGLTLTTDYKMTGTLTGPVNAMVRFYIGSWTGGNNYYVTTDAFAWTPDVSDDWVTRQVALAAENFQVWPNAASYNKSFTDVIAHPDDIGLVFCGGFTNNATLGISGLGTVMIDNFGAVQGIGPAGGNTPEPATLALLGFGAASMLLRRRRKS